MSLTNEDKEWVTAMFVTSETRISSVIDDRIAKSETRMTSAIDERITKSETRMTLAIDERITKSEEKLMEVMRGIETTLLTEFHKWARPNDARLRSHSARMHAFDLELEALTDRVEKLEPPPGQ